LEVQKQFIETGKVRYVFRHFPLEQMHPAAKKAAEASECAREQSKFWEFYDRLFANQKALALADLSREATSDDPLPW
jgi:protein-disulfide isomerase